MVTPIQNGDVTRYNFGDDEDNLCDLTMSSICSSSVSSMSLSSSSYQSLKSSTADQEAMARAFTQLKSGTTLSSEAHAELDQLVKKLIPNSSDTDATANLSEVSSDEIEKILGIKILEENTNHLLPTGSESFSMSSRFSLDISNISGYTDGTGTTKHHANGFSDILKRTEIKNSPKVKEVKVPRTVSTSCNSAGAGTGNRSSANENSSVLPYPLKSAPVKVEKSPPKQSKTSALGFIQSFFTCCTAPHEVDVDIPILRYVQKG
jgi:hypothetical protein